MIGETILHYKIIEKLGEPACRQAGAERARRSHYEIIRGAK
jgi:hypothetical protein